jgi:uncharacterized protein
MKLELDHTFPLSRMTVWDAMLNPTVLAEILPGVEEFEETAKYEFAATLNLGVPAVKGRYKGTVTITDIDEPSSYKLSGKGKGQQGWARGTGLVRFSEREGGTHLSIEADIQIGGRIAGIGQRMIEGVARMLAQEFFVSLEAQLQGQEVVAKKPIAFFFSALARWVKSIFGWSQSATSSEKKG